ncbi:hypothetical protein SAMN05421644_13817 [Allochromatium warmingii]|uniref:Uncharacterized protein n=1 Tax=Allochromatium warmingii TaxID=61595 RepID=A0A1H3I1C0_ALLWA|nr:hypothetical protein [Allochromatium warmingii]SDY20878.1 hypothetical protein SAMN05421644_13817 [Allochromatium warmingii]
MNAAPLSQVIALQRVFSRSINLARDSDSLDPIRHYQPTSRALDALRQLVPGLTSAASQRALALIGPYGAGKSAFALFLGALFAAQTSEARQLAQTILRRADAELAQQLQQRLHSPRGLLRVQINGLPDALSRQLLLGLAAAIEREQLPDMLVKRLQAAAQVGAPMDQILKRIGEIQTVWAELGGAGLLIEIDELGKFLEYEAQHPQQRDIHLLQLLAERAAEPHRAPLFLVVMLHQAFEYYGNRLGTRLREEWQKVQGRFGTLAFLEPAAQSLRLVATALERSVPLPAAVAAQLTAALDVLIQHNALPLGLEPEAARSVFERAYPLQPLTLLILPILCQKVAQNERTLFSYLASTEAYGLRQRLADLVMGDWIGPWELYEYFILNQADGFSDPITYHRWVEVVTALERFAPSDATDDAEFEQARRLLKTIGLLNLIGAQRGLKASRPVLESVFGAATATLLAQLEAASVIQFRQFAQEYRVWQGSDFDMRGALQQALAEQVSLSLADTLNALAPLRPIVARRASIETGTLRTYTPAFTARDRWPPAPLPVGEARLWFYLAEPDDMPDLSATPLRDVVAVCTVTERLRELVSVWLALRELPRQQAALHQDPVAQREHQTWLATAEHEALGLLQTLIEQPETLHWFFGARRVSIADRRTLQRELSAWSDACYPLAPKIRNELINRERPSTSAATGRKRLLAAMLTAAEQPELGIDKDPAEKSLYLSLLKHSGLHRRVDGAYGFFAPPDHDPCHLRPLWEAISDTLGADGAQQVPVPELYARLQGPPFGVRLGVLPILLVAYLLAQRRETALYQEGVFCDTLTLEQAELLCRRPALFALERYALHGLRGELFEQYLTSIVGRIGQDATLLDIVRPLVRFIAQLPDYSQHGGGVSAEAQQVARLFRHAKRPGALLFEDLPRVCGVNPETFAAQDPSVVAVLIERLIVLLRELREAYPTLLDTWRQRLGRALLAAPDGETLTITALRQALAARYRGLERYAPELSPVGALARRLADSGLRSDEAWLESVMTLLGGAPASKWRESNRLQAEARLAEFAAQLGDLHHLRTALPELNTQQHAVLLKRVDPERGEVSHVLALSDAERQAAAERATTIAASLADLDTTQRLAIIAALMEQMSGISTP